ncbi:hypothetical protein ACIHCQ_22255 [Streptomyces sp. NPDC052236]|uniref:hypothetical protein n=1 Tax=Streptomyces sp. NPDC052236 TaxID=3365686 RepID=UPI0037CDD748
MANEYYQVREYLRETVAAAEKGARRQRARNCVVYSVAVRVGHALDFEEQEQVSEVIHGVEGQGWALDKVTAFSNGESGYARQESVLLIFRATDR